MYVYLVVHNRTIQSCHSCHYILPLLLQFLLKLWMRCTSLPAFLLFSRLSWLAATKPVLSCFVILFLRSSLPRFPHHVHSSFWFCCAYSPLLHPPRPVPAPVPVPILRSFIHLHPVLLSPPSLSPTPFPSQLRHPPPIPPTTPFSPFRPSDARSLSVRCACTDTGTSERSIGGALSTTACLQR